MIRWQSKFLVALSFLATPAQAYWSCVSREGKLLTCESPASCRAYYPSCRKARNTPEACADPKCRAASGGAAEAAPAEPKAPESAQNAPAQDERKSAPPPPSPPPAPISRPAPPARAAPLPERNADFVPEPSRLSALAEKKIAELRALVHAHPKAPAPKAAPRPAGLSAEEEMRLFGSTGPAPETPATKAPPEEPWAPYMNASFHRRLVEELRRNKPLREEVRRKLATRPKPNTTEEKETNAVLGALLAEADNEPREVGHGLEDVKPLNPQDAFDLDEEDLERIRKR